MFRGGQQGGGEGESGRSRGSRLQAGRQSSGDRRNRGTQMDKAELSWMNCPIKFTSAVDWIRTLSRAATSDIIHIKLLFSQIWNAKIFVRWWNTVRLAKKQLNWKREIGEESFFSLMKWWIAKFFWRSATSLGFRLVYRAGNICNHFFTRDFLQVRFRFP